MIMAVVGGTVSELTGGKFANGAVSGAFVHLFNAEAGAFVKKFIIKKVAGKTSERVSNALGINKAMRNIIKSGASGLVGGIIGGIVAVAALPFTASVVAVATFGGAIGLTASLVEGAAMESSGANEAIEKVTLDAVIYLEKKVK